jgi:hypothetical protein
MVRWCRDKYWDRETDLKRRVTYVGVVVGFHFMMRPSEFAIDGNTDHAITSENVLFYDGDGALLGSSDRLSSEAGRQACSAKLLLWTDKAHKSKSTPGRELYLCPSNELEDSMLEDLIVWSLSAGLQKGDLFCSYRYTKLRAVGGPVEYHYNLQPKLVATAIKECAKAMGLNESEFSNRSLRIGGNTVLAADGTDPEGIRRVSGHSGTSSSFRLYQRTTAHDHGALGVTTETRVSVRDLHRMQANA